MAFLDGSFAPAKNGGEHVGLTRKGKGTKWMVVVERHGLPLGFLLVSANRAEVRLAEQTLDTICVRRPRGRPEKLVADRGYDSRTFRRALRRRGIRMCIPPKRRPAIWRAKRGRPVLAHKDGYRQRYTVERTFAWLGAFRRLLIRWERFAGVYQSFFAFALMVLSVRVAARSSSANSEQGATAPNTALQVTRRNRADFAGCGMLKVISLGDSCPAGT